MEVKFLKLHQGDASCDPNSISNSNIKSMSYSSSHEIVAIANIVAFEIIVIGYVALVNVVDEKIFIVVFSIVVYEKIKT